MSDDKITIPAEYFESGKSIQITISGYAKHNPSWNFDVSARDLIHEMRDILERMIPSNEALRPLLVRLDYLEPEVEKLIAMSEAVRNE